MSSKVVGLSYDQERDEFVCTTMRGNGNCYQRIVRGDDPSMARIKEITERHLNEIKEASEKKEEVK